MGKAHNCFPLFFQYNYLADHFPFILRSQIWCFPEAIPLSNIKAKTITKALTILVLLLWVFQKQFGQIRDPMKDISKALKPRDS
jgi:hypothetical protein